ncbi:MAG: polysaccharide deacetylase family protein [Verrucomicrobia bacterium]|nr:polysaccharide deacetylase family protein [Verrucomicrobiota bacterium]
MRLERLITLCLMRHLRAIRPGSSPSAPRLPILMYHSISDDPEPGVKTYYKVCTSPVRFAEQMGWLAKAGCKGVTLTEGLAWLQNTDQSQAASHGACDRKPGTPKPVAITFDDGFRDFCTAAFPILDRHGFSATMFLATGFVRDNLPPATPRQAPIPETPIHRRTGVSTSMPAAFANREFLSWTDVANLHQAGIEFGSHTVSHPVLRDLAWPEIESEIRRSKSEIEDRLGAPVRSFAHPYAFPKADNGYARRLGETLQAAGYDSCVTTMIGRARPGHDPFELPRLPANSDDDRSLLAAKLAGDYDWMARAQLVLKKLKHTAGRFHKETEAVVLRPARNH